MLHGIELDHLTHYRIAVREAGVPLRLVEDGEELFQSGLDVIEGGPIFDE